MKLVELAIEGSVVSLNPMHIVTVESQGPITAVQVISETGKGHAVIKVVSDYATTVAAINEAMLS